jgi:hypothetical protein
MDRLAVARAVRAGQVQDSARDWWAQHRAVVPMVHAAPARALLQTAVAVVHAAPGRAALRAAAATTATERRAAGHRVDPAEDSWQADSSQVAAGNRAAADRAAAAAAVAGHPERSTADAAGRRISSRIAPSPERPSQAPRPWQQRQQTLVVPFVVPSSLLPGGISQDAILIPHPDSAVNTGNTAGKGRRTPRGRQFARPKTFKCKGISAFQRGG